MADRRPGDQDAQIAVAEVRTAIQFLAKGVDRLETSVQHLEQTVREDFASTGDLELVKMSVAQLRGDVARLDAEIGARIDSRIDTRVGVADVQQRIDMKMVRWFLWVAIPGAAVTGVYWLWEAVRAYAKWAVTNKP